jgi:hypothetical protein
MGLKLLFFPFLRKRKVVENGSEEVSKQSIGASSGDESPNGKVAARGGAAELAPGVAFVARKKHRAQAPNPLSNAPASLDSNNSKKKKERKFRKFY